MKMPRPMDESYKMLIDGKWVNAGDGKTCSSYCPANGELLAGFADATKEDVDAAVKAAWRAFDSWKNVSPQERSGMLLKIADLIDANREKLAMVETLDNGKPIRETMAIDVPLSSDHFRYFAGAIRTEEGEAVMIDKETLSIILREPIGVVGQIIPWNFPLLMAAWKIAPAAGGRRYVRDQAVPPTSLSLLELAKLMDAGVAARRRQRDHRRGSTTGPRTCCDHPGFRKLAFTGSTEVGYTIADAAAKKLIPATLELGGKSANIFFPDAPGRRPSRACRSASSSTRARSAAPALASSSTRTSTSKFLADAVAAFKKVKVGMPWEKDTQMGSQVNEAQLQKILAYVEIGKKEGAKVAVGGARMTENGLDKGAFMVPTILVDETTRCGSPRRRSSARWLCFIKFKTEEEVIRMANDSDYGLGGAVWTKDINRAFRVARAVETGRMWVNNYNSLPAHAPFGGYKKSGIGRETHKMMLEHYTQKKNIFISLTEQKMGLY